MKKAVTSPPWSKLSIATAHIDIDLLVGQNQKKQHLMSKFTQIFVIFSMAKKTGSAMQILQCAGHRHILNAIRIQAHL